MKTYWIRMYCVKDVEFTIIDAFKTGETEEKNIVCIATRAEDKDDIYDFFDQFLCDGTFEIDFIEEKEWEVYGDFCSENGRFRMNKKYLNEKIDTIEDCLKRI